VLIDELREGERIVQDDTHILQDFTAVVSSIVLGAHGFVPWRRARRRPSQAALAAQKKSKENNNMFELNIWGLPAYAVWARFVVPWWQFLLR
jgi:hypothetical protein